MPELTLPWFVRAWAWLKKYSIALVAGVVSILGLAVWWTSRSQANRSRVADVAVAVLKDRVGQLSARRDELLKQNKADDVKVVNLDKQILANKRQAVALVKSIEGMTDEQVLAEFEHLGY